MVRQKGKTNGNIRISEGIKSESRSVVSDSLQPHRLYIPWNSPGQNTGVGSLSLLQGIFPTQGSNPDLMHCRRMLYQLSHKRSPRILEWVAYPFSSRFSWPGIELGVLHCRQILYQLSYQGSSDLFSVILQPKQVTWLEVQDQGQRHTLPLVGRTEKSQGKGHG